MAKQPILLTDQIVPPPALVRAELETLPAIIPTMASAPETIRLFLEHRTLQSAKPIGLNCRLDRDPAAAEAIHRSRREIQLRDSNWIDIRRASLHQKLPGRDPISRCLLEPQ